MDLSVLNNFCTNLEHIWISSPNVDRALEFGLRSVSAEKHATSGIILVQTFLFNTAISKDW